MLTSASNELAVSFFPQLFLQRRVAVLSVLRREDVKVVLDVGCGEGELLAVLSQPPPWLLEPIKNGIERDVQPLYPTLIAGLDVADLHFAAQAVKPSEEKRWCPLKVKLYQGGLQDFNPEFVEIECIVASEVIEHLSEEVLPHFAPMIMGIYRPRVLVVTTPNYTFNARFAPPTSPRQGFPDPTGRTNRVFRHDDHKFEWTVEEFNDWCTVQATAHGYHVKTYTIGRAIEKDPWGRDEELGGASQVAEFIRDDTRPRTVSVPPITTTVHTLIAEYEHPVHPEAGNPHELDEIGEVIRATMEGHRETLTWLEGLWFEGEIDVLCGGSMRVLIAAIQKHPRLEIVTNGKEKRSEWQVQLEEDESLMPVPQPDTTSTPDEIEGLETGETFEIPLDWENSGTWELEDIAEESTGWGEEPSSTARWGVQSDSGWREVTENEWEKTKIN